MACCPIFLVACLPFRSLPRARLNVPPQLGGTALHLAAREGHISTTRILLAAGASINLRNKVCSWPAGRACAEYYIGVQAGLSPLMAAIKTGAVAAVDTLLAAGAQLETVSSVRLTPPTPPLPHQATSRTTRQVVSLMRTPHSCDATCAAQMGETALHLACALGRTTICEALLKAGADATARNAVWRSCSTRGVWVIWRPEGAVNCLSSRLVVFAHSTARADSAGSCCARKSPGIRASFRGVSSLPYPCQCYVFTRCCWWSFTHTSRTPCFPRLVACATEVH